MPGALFLLCETFFWTGDNTYDIVGWGCAPCTIGYAGPNKAVPMLRFCAEKCQRWRPGLYWEECGTGVQESLRMPPEGVPEEHHHMQSRV